MKIIALEAENVKRLKAVRIEPTGPLVEIAGKNGQGKTSILDAIYWAICGTKHIQSKPIRDGEEEARISLDLGEIKVTRRFRTTKKGDVATEVVIENEAGARFPSPQAMLDALTGELAFDPLAFARAPAKQQFDMLRKFVPEVDFDAIDAANKADFQKRTDVNRRAKEARAAADQIGMIPEDVRPVDEDALVEALDKAGQENATLEQRKARREQIADEARRLRARAETYAEQAAEFRRKAADLDKHTDDARAAAADLEKRLADAGPLPDPVDTAPIRAQLAAAKDTNALVAKAVERKRLQERARGLEDEAEALTKAMEQRNADKQKAIAAAQMPVEGLSFGEGEVLLNGVPFEQGSDAEQLRASVAIAAAMNPKLRVIRVRDGSLLDDDAMKALEQLAAERDLQCWIERVGEHTGKFGVVIRDGMVVDLAEAAE